MARQVLILFVVVATVGASTPLVSPAAGHGGDGGPAATTGLHESHDHTTTVWVNETVDSDGRVGKFSSIAVDETGSVHISYYYQSNRDLRYARLDPDGTWTTETVHSRGDVGKYTAIAVSDDGTPHIVYFEETSDTLMYATRDRGSWTKRSVDDSVEYEAPWGPDGTHADIAVDADGVPHIAYFDWGDGRKLNYARWNGISWAIDTVEDREPVTYTVTEEFSGSKREVKESLDSQVGILASIAVDEDRDPHISYLSEQKREVECRWDGNPAADDDAVKECVVHAGADTDVKHAEWTGSRWDTETVSSSGQPTDITIKGGDTPVIAIEEPGTGSARVGSVHLAERNEDGWNVVTVDDANDLVEPQVELDDRGRYHVTSGNYQIGARRNEFTIQYMWKDGTELRNGTCRTCSTGWKTETATGDLSDRSYSFEDHHFSFAFDDEGIPHVSYYDEENENLMYATKKVGFPDLADSTVTSDCAVCSAGGSQPGIDEPLIPEESIGLNDSMSSNGSMIPNESMSPNGSQSGTNESTLIGVSSVDVAPGRPADSGPPSLPAPRGPARTPAPPE